MSGWRKAVTVAAFLGLALVIWMFTDHSTVVSIPELHNRDPPEIFDTVNHPNAPVIVQRTHIKSSNVDETDSRQQAQLGRKMKLDSAKEKKNFIGDKKITTLTTAMSSVNSNPKDKAAADPSLIGGAKKQDNRLRTMPDLPPDVINRVEKFVFFIGYQRSGHSIVGSFMDAHPHMIIAHEFMLFTKWKEMEEEYQRSDQYNSLKTKSTLFRNLYWDSYVDAEHGWRSGQLRNKNYTLTIDSHWQGRYDGYISVIGDKSGGATTSVYTSSPQKFQRYLADLKRTVGVPVKVLHVVRNPFDMIATDALYSEGKRQRSKTGVRQAVFVSNFKKRLGDLKAAGKLDEFKASRLNNQTLLESRTKSISRLANGNRNIIRLIGEENVLELHNSDLVNDPMSTLTRICSFLDIDCSHNYLKVCADKVFKIVSNTRELVVWPSSTRQKVEDLIKLNSFLSRYTFDSD